MSADDVARGLMAMDQEAVRRRVGEGDFSAVPATGLSEEERELLRQAAATTPEVTGYEFRPIWNPPGLPHPDDPYAGAISYARDGIGDAVLNSSFQSWLANKAGTTG